MKISALAGTSINGVPVLANRAWTGVVTVPQNQAVVVASEMDRQESRAISGWPGLSEIPGLNNVTNKDTAEELFDAADRDDSACGSEPSHLRSHPMVRIDATNYSRDNAVDPASIGADKQSRPNQRCARAQASWGAFGISRERGSTCATPSSLAWNRMICFSVS